MRMGRLEKLLVNRKTRAQRNIRLVQGILSRISLEAVSHVLEVGSGGGALSAHLSEKYGFKLTGTDLDEGQIALAKRNFKEGKRLSFLVADANHLPFEHGQFDMVLCLKVLHHIPEWPAALQETIRTLRPNGYLVLNDIAFPRPFARLLDRLHGNTGLYSLETLTSFIGRSGLSVTLLQKPTGILLKHFTVVCRKP